jgi:hypothetical protein
MLYSIDHAVGVARDLADRLSLRLTNNSGLNTVTQSQTTSTSSAGAGWPLLFVSHNGVVSEGNPVVGIRITDIQVGAIDIFGNSTLPFTPTQCEIAYELTSGGAPEPAIGDLSLIVFEVARTGMVTVIETIANGTAVTEASMNGSTVIENLKDIDWGYKGNT